MQIRPPCWLVHVEQQYGGRTQSYVIFKYSSLHNTVIKDCQLFKCCQVVFFIWHSRQYFFSGLALKARKMYDLQDSTHFIGFSAFNGVGKVTASKRRNRHTTHLLSPPIVVYNLVHSIFRNCFSAYQRCTVAFQRQSRVRRFWRCVLLTKFSV